MRSRSAMMLTSRSRACIRAVCWRDRRILARRPCPATAIITVSAAQAIIRRMSTEPGVAGASISEIASTTARAATLTQADSHGR